MYRLLFDLVWLDVRPPPSGLPSSSALRFLPDFALCPSLEGSDGLPAVIIMIFRYTRATWSAFEHQRKACAVDRSGRIPGGTSKSSRIWGLWRDLQLSETLNLRTLSLIFNLGESIGYAQG